MKVKSTEVAASSSSGPDILLQAGAAGVGPVDMAWLRGLFPDIPVLSHPNLYFNTATAVITLLLP